MAERKTLVDGKSVEYTGLISIQGLYRLVKNRLNDLGYKPMEDYHSEEVFEDGKQIIISMKGDNKLSDYAKIEWKTSFKFLHCQEVIIEKDGEQIRMHKCSASVSTTIFLTTDYDKSFEQNAFQYFLRAVLDKFVFKSYLSKAAGKASKDYGMLESEVQRYLNFERFD